VAETKAQRVGDRGDDFTHRNRKQLLPKSPRDNAVGHIDDTVDHENPHAKKVPLQAVLRPFANHQEVGKMQPAEKNIIVINPPAATDHDENRQRVDPMHDAQGQRMKEPLLARS